MTDNFDMIRGMLDFPDDDTCYYLQLVARKSDGNATNGTMHSRSVKDYLVCSRDQLDAIRDDVATLCRTFNVRAYIRLNRRSKRAIALEFARRTLDMVAANERFHSPYRMLASAAGTTNSSRDDRTWIVDLDAQYLDMQDTIMEAVSKCAPFHPVDTMRIVPTKSGRHLVCRPFNLKAFETWWKDRFADIRMPDIHKDNPTVLYVP